MRIALPYFRVPNSRHSFYTDFHDGLLQAIRESGHDPFRIEFAEIGAISPEEKETLYASLGGGCDVVLDICCWGYALSRTLVWDGSGEDRPIFDSHDAAYVGMLYDQPWFTALGEARSNRAYAAVCDRNQPAQIRLIYPDIALSGLAYVPPAARAENDRSATWSSRDIEVLYLGNFFPDALDRPWRAAPDARVYDAFADEALANPDDPLEKTLLRIAQAVQLDTNAPSSLKTYLRAIDRFLRMRLRYDAVSSLARAGLPLTVVGQGWQQAGLPATVRILPSTEYDGFLALAGRAKICLDASSYPGGLNDRVLNYAVNGAVCFSNAAAPLREIFGEDAGMQYYSLRALDTLADRMRAMLDATGQLRARGERSRELALSGQTWRHRLEAILAAINPQGSMPGKRFGD